jgi:mannose-6-phosphate isomerase-like protein (cupin superfamily)
MLGLIQGKVWGTTRTIFEKNNTMINYLVLDKGHSWCSKHHHEHRHNMFFVVSGKVKIRTWKKDYDLLDEIILLPEQGTSVAFGEKHSFEVLENSIMLEVYWVELDSRDIVRETVGGTDN